MMWNYKPIRVQLLSISLLDVKLILIVLLTLRLIGGA